MCSWVETRWCVRTSSESQGSVTGPLPRPLPSIVFIIINIVCRASCCGRVSLLLPVLVERERRGTGAESTEGPALAAAIHRAGVFDGDADALVAAPRQIVIGGPTGVLFVNQNLAGSDGSAPCAACARRPACTERVRPACVLSASPVRSLSCVRPLRSPSFLWRRDGGSFSARVRARVMARQHMLGVMWLLKFMRGVCAGL